MSDSPCDPVHMKLAPRVRLILLRGVARRFLLNLFCRGYVRRSIASRKGACRRCGVCCHLVANKCPSLRILEKGDTRCVMYHFYRMANCVTFPIDARDIADRDLVAPPDVPCGYFFDEKQK